MSDSLSVPRFAITPEWILFSHLSDRAKVLYAVLQRFDRGRGSAFPNHRTLASKLHCSISTVQRAIAELEQIGALRHEQRERPDGGQTSNHYTLLTDPPVTGDRPPPVNADRQKERKLEGEPEIFNQGPPAGERGPLDEEPEPQEQERSEDRSTVNGNGHRGLSPLRRQIQNALIQVTGWDPQFMTRDSWGRVRSAAKNLEEVGMGPETPSLIRGFRVIWDEAHPDTPISPQVVSSNWAAYCAGSIQPLPQRRR